VDDRALLGLGDFEVKAPEPAEPEPEPIEEIPWRASARGNPWTHIGRAHIVIFPSRRGGGDWSLRLQYEEQPGS
jgi:hypothetical protein